MIRHVFLDSSPLGLLTHPKGGAEVAAIHRWLVVCVQLGVQIVVPAIVYNELSREP